MDRKNFKALDSIIWKKNIKYLWLKRTMYKVCFKTLALLWSKTHKFCLLFSFQNKWGIGVEEQQCTAKTTQGQRQRQKANENAGSLTLCANVSPGVSTTDHISLSGKVNKRLLSLIHKTAMETTDSSIQNHLVPNESHEWFTWFSTTNQLLCDQWFPSHWKENMKTHNCTEWAVFLTQFGFATDLFLHKGVVKSHTVTSDVAES